MSICSAPHQAVHQRLYALSHTPLHACSAGVQRIRHQRRINGGAVGGEEAWAAVHVVHMLLSGDKRPAGSEAVGS